MTEGKRLGEVLIGRGLITHDELESALAEQRRSGSRLGDILVGRGQVSLLTLYQSVATHFQLPFVNLLKTPCSPELLRFDDVQHYIHLRVIPWQKDQGVLILATSEPGDELMNWAASHYSGKVQLVVTSPFDIRMTVEKTYSNRLEEQSRTYLHRLFPGESARKTFEPEQKAVFFLLFAALLTSAVLWPNDTMVWFVAVLNIIYSATMLFKWLVFRAGLRHPPGKNMLEGRVPLDDASLPVYTVLVPLYREKESLPHLLASLKKLDYPQSKLDIKLIFEADDTETIKAAMALKPAWNVEIIRVPPTDPRTKPKALNYGLRFARGEYVTVYDAEDEPEPMQIKKAVQTFRAMPGNVTCLQARLNYYNANHNILTRWFALEYGILFDALLPGLQALGIPIPLGGTSNHLALEQLRRLGEWDPYNVTEDADLGVRLASRGQATAVIDSITMEEAPHRLGPWIRQRSRWIKGYMQTWLVHMRDPLRLLDRIGGLSFMGFQFFVGLAVVTYLTAPIVWALSVLSWTGQDYITGLRFPDWMIPLFMFNLVLHFLAHWAQAGRVMVNLAGYDKNPMKFQVAALLFPFYWLLHSVASYKSLWQLLSRPHFWEKTAHGFAQRNVIDKST